MENEPTDKPEVMEADAEARFTQLWEDGDKVGALEIVMGRYINSSEISNDINLATVILQPTASDAYAAAIMVKMIEQIADKKNQS